MAFYVEPRKNPSKGGAVAGLGSAIAAAAPAVGDAVGKAKKKKAIAKGKDDLRKTRVAAFMGKTPGYMKK